MFQIISEGIYKPNLTVLRVNLAFLLVYVAPPWKMSEPSWIANRGRRKRGTELMMKGFHEPKRKQKANSKDKLNTLGTSLNLCPQTGIRITGIKNYSQN